MERRPISTAPIPLLFLMTSVLAADSARVAATRAVRVEQNPIIDGLVTDEVWSIAPVSGNFIQQQPDEGQPATERTEICLVHTTEILYLGIICFDQEPDKIVVSQGRRDGELTDTDSILVLLDTYNDNQNGFIFGTNPFSVEYDGQVVKEGRSSGQGFGGSGGPGPSRTVGRGSAQRGGVTGFNLNWDAIWTVQAKITDRGWEAEFAIPFKTLRYHSGKDQVWGFNVMRNIRRKNEQSFWAPVPRAYTIHRVSIAGDLEISPATVRNLQVVPYVLAGVQKDFEAGARDDSFDGGLDVKYGVTGFASFA